MSRRAASYLAWSLAALCVALGVASLILGVLNGRTLGEIFMAWSGPSIAALPTEAVSFSVVGEIRARRGVSLRGAIHRSALTRRSQKFTIALLRRNVWRNAWETIVM